MPTLLSVRGLITFHGEMYVCESIALHEASHASFRWTCMPSCLPFVVVALLTTKRQNINAGFVGWEFGTTSWVGCVPCGVDATSGFALAEAQRQALAEEAFCFQRARDKSRHREFCGG